VGLRGGVGSGIGFGVSTWVYIYLGVGIRYLVGGRRYGVGEH
jgi:hypothetical protein